MVKTQQINEVGYQLTVSTRIGDDLAAVAYLTLKQQGLLRVVFYEGEPSLKWFLEWFQTNDSVILGCFATALGSTTPVLAGLGWLTSICERNGVKRSEIGMVFFREWQHGSLPAEWCDQMIDFSFEQLGMSAIYGTTPEANRAAVKFSKQMGFDQFGPIPYGCTWKGKPCGTIQSVMTRAMWESGR